MTSMAFLVCILVAAVYSDLKERRVPNLLVVVGMIAGLAISFANNGGAGILSSAGAGLAAMAVFIPFFALHLLGAGDVKLLGVVGTFVGLDGLLPVLLFILMAGGILGLGAVVASGRVRQFFWNMQLWLHMLAVRGMGTGPTAEELAAQSAARIPYAVAIAAGVLIWMMIQA